MIKLCVVLSLTACFAPCVVLFPFIEIYCQVITPSAFKQRSRIGHDIFYKLTACEK